MLQRRGFWLAIMLAIVVLYAGALAMIAQGHPAHPLVRISILFVLAHILELPLAFRALRERQPGRGRLIAATLVFGAAWWLPARRGVFAVR
jgi:hypothetical protein